MRVFKSKKELIALVIAAVLFAGVIYKMYVSKEEPAAMGAAPSAPAPAAVLPGTTPPPSATTPVASVPAVLASLDEDAATPDSTTGGAATPERNPFQMSAALRTYIYGAQAPPKQATTSTEAIVLTPDNARAVLSRIPGAEQAAAAGLTLEAVMLTDDWRGASINGEITPLGDLILGFKLVEVFEDRVTLERGKHRIALFVRPPASSGTVGGTRTWRLPK